MNPNTAYTLARADLGTWEWSEGHNPKVVQYFSDVGQGWVKDDETAWCAAFVGAMLERSGAGSTRALNARSYLDYGTPVDLDDAQPGDIVVFSRGDPKGWQGHVAFFAGRTDNGDIQCLGGNQRNQVCEQVYSTSRLLGVRRPPVKKMKQPRTKPSQSTTIRATGGVAAAIGSSVPVVLPQLDPTAQVLFLLLVLCAGLGLAWIFRERLRKWRLGDK